MRRRRLVAGVDSSTQSCKVLVCDATTGAVVRSGRAGHPDGTEVDPEHWWQALLLAIDRAGGLDGVDAVSVAAQQHGMVCLDAGGSTVRPALLWNDTRSARTARDLVREHGGPAAWARDTGSVPLASFTVAKLRWLAEHEPDAAAPPPPCACRTTGSPGGCGSAPAAWTGSRPTTATPPAPATTPRPRGRGATTCWRWRWDAYPRCPGSPARPTPRATSAASRSARGRATTWRPHSDWASNPGTSSCRWARPARCSRSARPRRPTPPGRSPASPTRPGASCPWCAR